MADILWGEGALAGLELKAKPPKAVDGKKLLQPGMGVGTRE